MGREAVPVGESSRRAGAVQEAVGGGGIACSVDVLLTTAVAPFWAILMKAIAAVGAAEHSEQPAVGSREFTRGSTGPS